MPTLKSTTSSDLDARMFREHPGYRITKILVLSQQACLTTSPDDCFIMTGAIIGKADLYIMKGCSTERA